MISGHNFGHELVRSDTGHEQKHAWHAGLGNENLQVTRTAGDYGSRG